MAKGKRQRKGSWVVRVRQTIIKELYCENCTEDEAKEDPFDHATSSKVKMYEECEVLEVQPGDD